MPIYATRSRPPLDVPGPGSPTHRSAGRACDKPQVHGMKLATSTQTGRIKGDEIQLCTTPADSLYHLHRRLVERLPIQQPTPAMSPQTRSRGVPPSSRVYHSTPAQQQAQFPPRRKVIRTYGKQKRKKEPVVPARSLRQQTLTQIDFVSSFEEDADPTVFSDSDEEIQKRSDEDAPVDEDKENQAANDNDNNEKDEKDEKEEDKEPVSSGRKRRVGSKAARAKNKGSKRRRTLGDESEGEPTVKKEDKPNRRKTLGDLATSSYHTQTLTQFLGRDPANALYIKDSEDEDEDEDDNGFRDWLYDPTSPSPLRHRPTNVSPSTQRRLRFASPKVQPAQNDETASNQAADREESVVPQTPAKRTRRDEIPSSSQLSTPVSANIMINRYGAPNNIASPLKNKSSPMAPKSILRQLPGKPRIRTSVTPRRKEVVIQDSFATESWETGGVAPLRSQVLESPGGHKTPSAETSSAGDDMDTPTKPKRGRSTELGDAKKSRTGSSTPKRKRVSPLKDRKNAALEEIPDSDADDDFEVFNDNGDEEQEDEDFIAGPETQFVMSEMASSAETSEEDSAKENKTPPSLSANEGERDAVVASSATSRSRQRPHTSSPPLPAAPSSQPTTLPPPSSPPKQLRASEDNRPRLRKPLHQPFTHIATQTQPLESQRVPLATLQALPAPSARTDIILPLDHNSLLSVVEGFEVHVVLPFKIPAQVVRFWLFDGEMLRYMACSDARRVEGPGSWRYNLPQVYELNNPVSDSDMREEEWVDGNLGRYAYLPPAVVGQLMWNLRHAVFSEGDKANEEEDEPVQLLPSSSAPPRLRGKNPTPTPSMSVSQQVEAQIQSDIAQSTQFPASDDILVPSTPEDEGKQKDTTLDLASTTPTRASPSKPSTIKRPARVPPPTSSAASSRRTPRLAMNPPTTGAVRPSQATTVSQASTPENPPSSSHRRLPSYPQLQSSSSIVFNDDSPLHMPPIFHSGSAAAAAIDGSSQLLSGSQMLPDSLVRDDEREPPEIWDSDEDANDHL